MTDRELMQMALDAFEWNYNHDLDNIPDCNKWLTMIIQNMTALRERLSQPEPEPVGWGNKKGEFKAHEDADENFKSMAIPFYAAPPKREWVGLTNEEIDAAVKSCNTVDTYKYFRAIEAKLKEKNT